MQIRPWWDAGPVTGPERLPSLPDEEGGDPACWVRRVCPACGRLADENPPTRCPACGADLPDD
ncbi:MAG: DNA-binding transcriptional regulator, MarR family [Blastococcus sp.]|jgi:rubrerythrin|nr:DNA-binding transcriptional regulator, MarR family [Blastococcus sp.]